MHGRIPKKNGIRKLGFYKTESVPDLRACTSETAPERSAMSLVLGIESSCDETAVAIVEDGQRLLAERIASQADDFAAWGGVVPELAARGHVASLPSLIEAVLADAELQPSDIDAIGVSAFPGLIGSLLCGVTAAKAIAAAWDKPLVAVNHIQAHLAAIHLSHAEVRYPLLGLVASGGHSHYYRCAAPGQLELVGGTIDDAAGEAFDKAAACIELDYPGGPNIDRRAASGNPKAMKLPRPFAREREIKLSFAGLKTAFLYQVRGPQGKQELSLDEQGINDACASFQAAVVDCLSDKLLLAAEQYHCNAIAVGGGVACNSGLRQRLSDEAKKHHLDLYMPAPKFCGDNASMIACLAYYMWQRGETHGLDFEPLPSGRVADNKMRK